MDINFVRSQFPALKKDFIFMDNAGGSQTLGKTINYISDYLINTNVQLGASYKISAEAGKNLNDVKSTLANFLNARRRKGTCNRAIFVDVAQDFKPLHK